MDTTPVPVPDATTGAQPPAGGLPAPTPLLSLPPPPDPAPILELINAFRRSAALFTAVQLGVFDALLAEYALADPPCATGGSVEAPPHEPETRARALVPHACSAAQLQAALQANGTQVDGAALERLLRTLVAMQLLACPGQQPTEATASTPTPAADTTPTPTPTTTPTTTTTTSTAPTEAVPGGPYAYQLTPVSAYYLTSASPGSLTGYIVHSQKVVWPLFGGLPHSVASGGSCWRQQLGCEGADMFRHIYATPADALRFMRGMHSFATMSAPAVMRAFELPALLQDSSGGGGGGGLRTLVDLGGATGALAVEALRAYPCLESATVVDLPQVVAAAQEHFCGPSTADVGARLRWVAADMFAQPELLPTGADVYVLSRILHDWEEDKCMQVLRLVHSALRPGGALLVCEMLLQEDGLGPLPALLQDLNMLCQTRGRERSVQQYAALLRAAGFRDVQGRRTGTYLDAVCARK